MEKETKKEREKERSRKREKEIDTPKERNDRKIFKEKLRNE